MNRFFRLSLLAAVLAAPVMARPAHAQEIDRQARQRGVRVPEAYRKAKQLDPHAFEFKRAWKSALRRAQRQRAAMRTSGATGPAGSSSLGQRSAAVQGTFKVPVIPVLYSNTSAAPYMYTNLQARLFGVGSATSETVTHVYDEMSRGKLALTGTVMNWVKLPQTDTYYEGSEYGLGAGGHLGAFIKAALDSADQTVNFAQFDSDGDGYVDFVAFVQPEAGAECGGNKNLWSHRYYVDAWLKGVPYKTNDVNAQGDTIRISDYVLQPALNCPQLGGGMIDIGVFAHEFGHAFGLPDLYDTGDDPQSEGIGEWGLMGAGNWNSPASPSHMEAWSKMQLGWEPVVTVSRDTTITLAPSETNGSIVRIDIPNTTEYFLLENRQRIGSDAKLHGTGLLVFHVDSATVDSGWDTNNFQNVAAHKGLDLVEADGNAGLDLINYRGSAADIFPGSTGVTSFTPIGSPNTNSYNNAGTTLSSAVSITNITQANGNVTFTVSFGTPAVVTMRWGDLNGDGVVSVEDYRAAYTCVVGGACPGATSIDRADFDRDGRLSMADALIIQSYVAGVDVSRYRAGQAISGP